MTRAKYAALRSTRTGYYLNGSGDFVKTFNVSTCMVRIYEKEGKSIIRHDMHHKYLSALKGWSDDIPNVEAQFFTEYCDESHLDILRTSSSDNKNGASNLHSDRELFIEERDERKVISAPTGNYQILSNSQLDEINTLAKGGSGLTAFANKRALAEDKSGNLVKKIGETPEAEQEHLWVKAHLKDGTPIQYSNHFGARITVIYQKKVSKFGAGIAEKLRQQSAHNANEFDENLEEDYGETSELVFMLQSGETTTFQNFVNLSGKIVPNIVLTSLLVKGLNAFARNMVLKGVQRTISRALALGLENSMTQELWYVRLTSYLTRGPWYSSGRLIAGAFNLGAALAIGYAISVIIELYVFVPQKLRVSILNMTKSSLNLGAAYLDNVPENLAAPTPDSPYNLPAMTTAGEVITIDPILGPITADQTVVYGADTVANNDNIIAEGLGILYSIVPNSPSSIQNVFASVDIPYARSNNLNIDFDVSSTNYKSIFNRLESGHKELSYSDKKGDVAVEMSLNALTGSDHDYVAQILIKPKT
ncbi:hypothetical protein [Pseudoalteromonas sp. Of7M-16]|uniref:hypothetical protein n=1 Tax=Pseudoalteromonas sp. Of7M-16 TaxID=2917756 RepID=UPI001EF531E1|nr:hypothetical protein [Pseudoalteromonas sp. Of7M-16]MCG7548216.1 hypothetical protein [Pseudoalteromonas sp. Of7M-16]